MVIALDGLKVFVVAAEIGCREIIIDVFSQVVLAPILAIEVKMNEATMSCDVTGSQQGFIHKPV